ncbi:S-adenosyl-L-methionine-dependent methyltransferase, partial [Sodiomyces alkalinus F11]
AGGDTWNAIVVEDDDANVTPQDRAIANLSRAVRNYQPRRRTARESRRDETQSLDEVQHEEDILGELGEVIDLTADDDPIVYRAQPRQHFPAPIPIPLERSLRELVLSGGRTIKVNFCYQVCSPQNRYFKVEFLRVTEIIQRGFAGHEFVRGIPYARNKSLGGRLPRKRNEVFAIYEVQYDDLRPVEQQGLVEIPALELGVPRRLHITNAPFPAHRYDPNMSPDEQTAEQEGPLVCRWKVFAYFHDARTHAALKACEWAIARIASGEVPEAEFRVNEETLSQNWRGSTIRGGAHNPPRLVPSHRRMPVRGEGQQYEMFDAFCGAGGASRGAERAGFKIKGGIDMARHACESYRLNFPRAKLFPMTVHEFLFTTRHQELRADVLHLSPPCQVWSPAHTVDGVNDDANVAALFSCRQLIEKFRPRIFTLEQTFGILQKKFELFFNGLVAGFTDSGYSVAWKVISMANYGLPQRRKRLIMLGAGPGEKLPDWPPHTHSETGRDGLRKYTSIRQALRKINNHIERTDPHHRPVITAGAADAIVSDPDGILRRCMTTSGGQNRHYSGTRNYTNREFACLQGFPVWHRFSEYSVRKQIGNAFPPCVVQVFYEHIQKHLHRADGFVGSSRPRPVIGERSMVLTVD